MWYKFAFQKLAGLKEDLLRILGGDSHGLARVREICPEPKFQTITAYFLMQNIREDQISLYVQKLAQLENFKKIKNIFVSKSGVHLNDKIFTDWIAFTEAVDGLMPAPKLKDLQREQHDASQNTLIAHGKNIEVHRAKNVVDACNLGRGMSWCISQPGNTMYQSYRDTQQSTFYFIVDHNREPSDPLHRVVVDMTANGVLLTDENNSTGSISEFGEDTDAYFDYLKGQGVDTSIFVNDPITEQEKIEKIELSDKPSNMTPAGRFEWFKNLSLDHKSKFIGRGFALSFPEFQYILDSNLSELMNQYLNSGHGLSSEEFALIANNNQYRKTYIRARKQLITHNPVQINAEDNQIPELQQDIKDICDTAKDDLYRGIVNYTQMPRILRDDVEFSKDAFYDGLAKFYNLPTALREDTEFAMQAYEDRKAAYTYLPLALKRIPELGMKALTRGSASFYDLPPELRCRADFAKIGIEAGLVEFTSLCNELRNNPEFAQWALDEDHALYRQLPAAIRDNEEFATKALYAGKMSYYGDLPTSLIENDDFLIQAYRDGKLGFYALPPDVQKQLSWQPAEK